MGRFGDLLNGANQQAGLWRLVGRVLINFAGGLAPSRDDGAAASGLACFLDTAATAIPAAADLKLLRDVLTDWPPDLTAARLTGAGEDANGRNLAASFYRACATSDSLGALSEPQIMMALASAMHPAEGILPSIFPVCRLAWTTSP